MCQSDYSPVEYISIVNANETQTSENSFQLAFYFMVWDFFEVDKCQTADGHLKINQTTDIFRNAIKMNSI